MDKEKTSLKDVLEMAVIVIVGAAILLACVSIVTKKPDDLLMVSVEVSNMTHLCHCSVFNATGSYIV